MGNNGIRTIYYRTTTLIFTYAILLYLAKIRYGTIKGKMLFVWLAGTILCAHIILFRTIYYTIFREPIRGYGWMEKLYYPKIIEAIAYLLMTALFIGIVLLLIKLEKKILQKWMTEVGEFSCKYKEVDYYFIVIAIINSFLLMTDMSEKVEFAAWRQDKNELIENRDLGSTESVSLIQIYGREDFVLPVHFLTGNNMIHQDDYGCMISDSVARTLFHSVDVLGREIICQGKVYYVRGVFQKSDKIVVIKASQTKQTFFQNYEFLCMEHQEQAYKQISKLLEQKDFPEAVILRDGNTIVTLVTIIRMIPIWIVIGYVFLKPSGKKNYLFIRLLLGGLLLLILIRYSVVISVEWIPTRWSDFDFWVIKYQSVKEYLQKDFYIQKGYKEVYQKELLICYVILVSIISLLECFVLNKIKRGE